MSILGFHRHQLCQDTHDICDTSDTGNDVTVSDSEDLDHSTTSGNRANTLFLGVVAMVKGCEHIDILEM